MQLFSVKVIASNRVFYEGKCRSLVLPELDGEKGILAHHENMIIAIENGVDVYKRQILHHMQEQH